jgi:hypothetical protein
MQLGDSPTGNPPLPEEPAGSGSAKKAKKP